MEFLWIARSVSARISRKWLMKKTIDIGDEKDKFELGISGTFPRDRCWGVKNRVIYSSFGNL
jgi:hypothetical protein